MQIIPLSAVPSQTVSFVVNFQPTTLRVYQKFYGLYVDVLLNDVLVIGGVIAENFNRIIRSTYLGYVGDFIIFDTQGSDDPEWTGLGTRFVMAYLTPAEVALLKAGQ